MRTPVTLGLFGAGLAVVFTAATAVGAAVGPVGPARPAEHGTGQVASTADPAAEHGGGHSPEQPARTLGSSTDGEEEP